MSKKRETGSIQDLEMHMNMLKEIVDKMEGGQLPLEQSLKYFEDGIKLTQQCQKILNQAELKVEQLIKKNSSEQLEEFPISGTEFDE